jgi:hypothetical protein
LYDLFVLSFVQLLVSAVLVLSPAREIGTRFRWTGSPITEVLVGSVGAVAITGQAAGFQGYGMASYSFFDGGAPIYASSAFQTANPPGSNLHDLLTVFLSTAGSGGIEHVVNGTGPSSTAANPDAAVDVVSYP